MNWLFPVYIVDVDTRFRSGVEELCGTLGLANRSYASAEQFLEEAEGLKPGCIILEMRMPRLPGLKIQAELTRKGVLLPVIAVTKYGDVEEAVASMKLGAIEYLEKPIDDEAVAGALNQAFELLAKQALGPE